MMSIRNIVKSTSWPWVSRKEAVFLLVERRLDYENCIRGRCKSKIQLVFERIKRGAGDRHPEWETRGSSAFDGGRRGNRAVIACIFSPVAKGVGCREATDSDHGRYLSPRILGRM